MPKLYRKFLNRNQDLGFSRRYYCPGGRDTVLYRRFGGTYCLHLQSRCEPSWQLLFSVTRLFFLLIYNIHSAIQTWPTSALKMEALCSSETFVHTYLTTWHLNPEEHSMTEQGWDVPDPAVSMGTPVFYVVLLKCLSLNGDWNSNTNTKLIF